MLNKNMVEIDGKRILVINRPDLDELIKQSQTIRQKLPLRLDTYDTYTLLRLQFKDNFIITGTKGLNNHDNTIIYSGTTFDNNVPIDNDFEIIISDIDHLSSTRFAYAAYKMMYNNQKKYSQTLEKNNLMIHTSPEIITQLEDHFRKKLGQRYLI
jgi:hypothetical protein